MLPHLPAAAEIGSFGKEGMGGGSLIRWSCSGSYGNSVAIAYIHTTVISLIIDGKNRVGIRGRGRGGGVITPRGAKHCRLLFIWNLLLTFFGSSYCMCAYIRCFKEEGWKYFCRFVFICFTL